MVVDIVERVVEASEQVAGTVEIGVKTAGIVESVVVGEQVAGTV